MTMRRIAISASLVALFVSPWSTLHAASLQVAPVSVEVPAPGAAATMTLRNDGDKPVNAQIRVYRWTQIDGIDKLELTTDVVASPPMAMLRPKSTYSVRIVRTTKQPVASEESYRLLIDELPGAVADRPATVNIALRYSIPLFFRTADATPPKLKWVLEQHNGKPLLTARNDGDRHVRLAKMKVEDTKGAAASFGDGLAGYVLGHSSRIWEVPNAAKGFGANGLGGVTALADIGPINTKQ